MITAVKLSIFYLDIFIPLMITVVELSIFYLLKSLHGCTYMATTLDPTMLSQIDTFFL
jgi:hypothetical protein